MGGRVLWKGWQPNADTKTRNQVMGKREQKVSWRKREEVMRKMRYRVRQVMTSASKEGQAGVFIPVEDYLELVSSMGEWSALNKTFAKRQGALKACTGCGHHY